MIHIFVNALAASAGGGLTYIQNVIPQLGASCDVRATVLLSGNLRSQLPSPPNVQFIEREISSSAIRRVWFEQRTLRNLLGVSGAQVLLSTGNFALWDSPTPQILLSRNALYTSHNFDRDLKRRGDYRLWIETRVKAQLAKWSIQAANLTIAPSKAFADELEAWSGKPITAIHHGFDRDAFIRDRSILPTRILECLSAPANALRLLFVSHYNYYRNFETLIRALPLVRRKIKPRELRLFLTCRFAKDANPGTYHPEAAGELVRALGLTEEVVELGTIPYSLLHELHKAVDLYVSPAYAESFAHPLVEAMSSRLPVVASDLPVHKEICGGAAVYFSPFSSQELADAICRLSESPPLASLLAERGVQRSEQFSWKVHVERIVSLACDLVSTLGR
jgi:glycosyltransferase involved in cell wall biosynthesis